MSRCVVYQSGGFTNYGISYRKYSQEELAEMENRAMTENEKAINIRAIKALEEVQQYRALGTPEECRAAMEKQTAKKAITYRGTNRADCPACGATVRGIGAPFGNWCSKCGQRLDWEDEE